MICHAWKVMFHAEYSSGQPLRMLVDLRAAVDDARENRATQPRSPRAQLRVKNRSDPASLLLLSRDAAEDEPESPESDDENMNRPPS